MAGGGEVSKNVPGSSYGGDSSVYPAGFHELETAIKGATLNVSVAGARNRFLRNLSR